ncbi:hypothetical protein HG536_0F00890 [Torulaspora globosa]|uniref:Phosphatidylinositol transfer protein SFH5 n=1 Tax=Torulaspora globosa TaxID=48254 RepID=A0A7G3ZJS8_9SACH|nr:uncharacterized protein HG536_0F00890 [Torulaspora globosa]QLL33764.1 hypothetical protein HG536_0F00890 [Torulaspora globosa]
MVSFSNSEEQEIFERVFAEIPSLIKDKCDGYDELYGYKLNPDDEDATASAFYKKNVAEALILKLCKAYRFQHEEIVSNFVKIMKWRSEFNPLSAAFLESHNKELQEVGILASYPEGEPNNRVVTWNLYGHLVKKKHLFKDADKFVRYRIGLMERGLRLLDFLDSENDYMTQVHDYKGVSVLRMDSDIKKCTKQIIAIFQQNYPELLFAKYFVNVPTLLQWFYDIVKAFVDKETMKKFVVLNDGSRLGNYLQHCPKNPYGGLDVKNTLQEENVAEVRPTEYALYLLEKQNNEDID